MWFFGDVSNGIEVLTTDVGNVSWVVFVLFVLADTILSFIALLAAFKLMGRRVNQLKVLKTTLIFLVLTHSVLLYDTVLKVDTVPDIGFIVVLLFGLVLFGAPTMIIFKIYSMKFMKDFFEIGAFNKKTE